MGEKIFEGNNDYEVNKKWVGTWGASPYLITPDNMPPSPGIAHNTLRQVIKMTISGDKIRLKISNQYGQAPLTMNSVHLAVSEGSSAIKADTDLTITFDGSESVTVPAGQTVISDTMEYHFDSEELMAVSIHFGDVPDQITGHPGSRTNSYIVEGNAVTVPSMDTAVKTERWYVISGIDVLTDNSSRSVVAFGDSITDGRGSTTDKQNKWTDILASRLQQNPATKNVGVINQGIGGNAIFGGLGPAAIKRFDRDVLDQPGIRYLIVFIGINDIGWCNYPEKANEMIDAYKQFIQKAHDKDILVYGGTILPCGGNGDYYNELHEQIRTTVNDWIRNSGEYDGVIDFDAAIRNPELPTHLFDEYDCGDHLHLSPEGYNKMGSIIDLELFTR